MTTEPTREVGIGIAALVITGFSLIGGIAALIAGGWWLLALVLLVPLTAVCGYGAAESFKLAERDEHGTPIPDGHGHH